MRCVLCDGPVGQDWRHQMRYPEIDRSSVCRTGMTPTLDDLRRKHDGDVWAAWVRVGGSAVSW
jgi:hypothetical protein